MRHRKYTHKQAVAGVAAKLRNILDGPSPNYPLDRVPGYIVQFVNNRFQVVDLLPEGYCNQHRAIFQNGIEIVAGMDAIHAELRKRMPPLLGWRNL